MLLRLSASSRLLFVVSLSSFAVAGFLNAVAQELPRVAFTEAPAEDMNFPLMGEFVGPITVGENTYEPLGIQIRPIGNDTFEALQFRGGLPGQTGAVQPESEMLIGRRASDLVVLSGSEWAVFVQQDHCLVVDREGQKLGRLERIERSSPSMNAAPPEGATVLFNGAGTENFTPGEMTAEGLLKAGADLIPMYQDFNLHVEFRLPYMPNSDGQQRGNSGCYLQSRYEVQVLDSFAQLPLFNGCSSLYRTKKPDVNMCLPPLVWQTYDIIFTAPRWAADGSKLRDAHITVWHNGIKTQDNVALKGPTGAGKPEQPSLLPIRFQNHSDPVVFRNIWIVDRGLNLGAEFPVEGGPNPPEPAVEKPAEATAEATVTTTAATARTTEAVTEAKETKPEKAKSKPPASPAKDAPVPDDAVPDDAAPDAAATEVQPSKS